MTHWVWAVCLFFLLLSGLQIFNAHPALYIGKQSGFEFDNAVLQMYADDAGSETAATDGAEPADKAGDNASAPPNTQADANANDPEEDGGQDEEAAVPKRGVAQICSPSASGPPPTLLRSRAVRKKTRTLLGL